MSDLHILFPTPVYQNVLDFRPSELKSMLDFMSELEWAPDRDIVNRPNGETTKLEADLLDCPELKKLENKIDVLFVGTGHEICHISEDFSKTVEKMGLNLEIMSTPSACRTYNVLLSEGRRIAIAALTVEGR